MLQETVRRLAGLEAAAPMVVCNEAHRFLVAEQLRAIDCKPRAIVLEPAGRNTAPAIALAAHAALAGEEGDPLLLVLPADHVIRDVAAFHRAIEVASAAARDGALVDLRHRADQRPRPATATSGAARAPAAATASPSSSRSPMLARAQAFLASGEYYWNSGMFLFRARRYLEELEKFAPDIAAACRNSFAGAARDLDFTRVDAGCVRVTAAANRSTMRSWRRPPMRWWCRSMPAGATSAPGLRCTRPASSDAQGNALFGDVMVEDTHDSYIYSESRLVATVGLRDHVVVETKDAVLVAPKDRVQDVKKLVARLKADGRYEHALHREVFRPWGSYDSIDDGERFQVKRLMVHPGGVLSLQMHHHRAEHWVVVSGTATHHARRGDFPAGGESIDLHSGRRAPSHRESGPHSAAHHRGAVGQLSRRGRYRALRRSLRAPGYQLA